jgi:hypothetical protein
MNDKKENDYEVGYKKPPVAARYPKGKSGNPKGRPKEIAEEFDPGRIFQAIDNEEIILEIDRKNKRMRKGEIYFQQLFTKAIGGSLTEAKLIAKMAAKYFGPEAQGPSEAKFIVVPNETLSGGETPTGNEGKAWSNGKSNGPKRTKSKDGPRQVSTGSQFRKVALEKISIKVGGTRHKMSRWDAYGSQIYTMALNKNSSAAHLLHQIRKQFPGKLLPGDPVFYNISEADAKL